ncbi:hypothetical protein [uncultured Aquitalea sp.]|uniref:hypothetical protein n=1 Tax=uncultured Aquitalea sp. TaxID=540272 RepID=UPI0025D78257|nr:hypothetical protein [uncultured Aquitalea sp.]
MFFALFGAIVVVSLATSIAVVRFFDPAVYKILQRTLGQDLADAWRRYVSFAILVAGISGGVRTWNLEQYLPPAPGKGAGQLDLTGPRWLLEMWSTLTETLRSIALVMLLFFLCSMMAYVIARALEVRRRKEMALETSEDSASGQEQA